MTPFNFIRSAFAAWYLAHVLVLEAGPLNMFVRIRAIVNPYGAWLTCTVCFSFWAALLVGWLPSWLVNALALAGGSVAVDGWVSR